MLTNRPPIIVILGHIDHGKTTLLDSLHKTDIASREAGGITQHTRSFQLAISNSRFITFIDTPGHQAFSAMRSRGNQMADIALLIVSAVDGVMPQTKESIQLIKSTNTEFIVVITKTDLSSANVDRVKTQLAEFDVIVEDLGGQVPAIAVSAKTGDGLSQLLELITLVNDLHPIESDPDAPLSCFVLESKHDPKRGPVATVIVKNGTLKVGQSLYQMVLVGKVKALTSTSGDNLSQALPSTPVEILGLTIVPEVGSEISSQPIMSYSSKPSTTKTITNPALKLILRADVAGSLEAIKASLPKEIQLINDSSGEVTESDVLLAKTTNSTILAFNTKISSSVAKLADTEHVKISSHKIIYELLEEIDKLLAPPPPEIVTGEAQVLATFSIDGDLVAGAKCVSGQIQKSDQVKVIRKGEEIGRSRVKSLRLGKTETSLVKTGLEFGAILKPQVAIQVGDSIMSCNIQQHG